MTSTLLTLRPLLAFTIFTSMVVLVGCGAQPQTKTVATEEITRTIPAPASVSTTTTTTRQVQ